MTKTQKEGRGRNEVTNSGTDVGYGKYLFTISGTANWYNHYSNKQEVSQKSGYRSTT